MRVWPAIDILGGRCVRLRQGDYRRETVFSDDPVAVARQWVDQGAECLHLVDLDGARDGQAVNRPVIEAIVKSVEIPCELGGGVRDEGAIQDWLDLGLAQLVLGTRAIQDADWFRQMVRRYPDRLVLGIDAREGRVATEGWLQTSEVLATELAQWYRSEPLAALVYTDISLDGMLQGPNFAAMAAMKRAADCPVLASGGVTGLDDVGQLARLGLDGCIIGRALYEGRLRLPEVLAVARWPHATAGGETTQPR